MEEHGKLQPQYRVLVLLASIGFFMQALDTTIVLLPYLPLLKVYKKTH